MIVQVVDLGQSRQLGLLQSLVSNLRTSSHQVEFVWENLNAWDVIDELSQVHSFSQIPDKRLWALPGFAP